jgi:hypothetical protein
MLTAEEVIFAYRLLLARSPESDEIVENYVKHSSIDDLRRMILGSREFVERMLTGADRDKVSWFQLGQIDSYQATGRRLEHLASLGLSLWGKTVLDVGAGNGLLASFFIDRKCKVLVTDSNAHLLEFARFVYTKLSDDEMRQNVSFEVADFDVPQNGADELRKEIVFCYDTLWQSKAPRIFLENLANACEESLLLETRVAFGSHEELFVISNPEQRELFGEGAMLPTRRWVLQRLKSLFPFVYVPVSQPWLDSFPTNWEASGAREGFGRTIFLASRCELNSSALVSELPLKQTRA